MSKSQPVFLPTPMEIEQATAKIREAWSEKERLRRMLNYENARPTRIVVEDYHVWQPPTIATDTSGLAQLRNGQ